MNQGSPDDENEKAYVVPVHVDKDYIDIDISCDDADDEPPDEIDFGDDREDLVPAMNDEDLSRVKTALSKMTRGPWRWWTSNSLRRLSSDPSGKDGDVASAYRCKDGVVDIEISQEDMDGIVLLRNHGDAIVRELERLRTIVDAMLRERDPDPDNHRDTEAQRSEE